MKKVIIVLIILIVAGFALYKFIFSPKTTYREARVEKIDLEIYINASGKVKPVREEIGSFSTIGQVEMIASSGASFKKGEILARLKANDLYASLQSAYAGLNKARSNFYYYLEAKGQADRAYGWKEDRDSKSQVSQANNNVAIAQDGVEAAQFAVDLAKATYNKAFIKASFDGVVGQTSVKLGETVAPGQTVLTFLDPSAFYFESEIDEIDVKTVRVGQKAKIKLDSLLGEVFEGEVYSVDLTPHLTNSGGTAYNTKISFKALPAAAKLRPGLNGEAEVLKEVKKQVLVVPAAFVSQKDGKSFILVKPAGATQSAQSKEVVVGEFVNGQYEIVQGITESETVLSPTNK